MTRNVRITLLSFTALPLFVTAQCFGQEPADPQSTNELRREVTELRAAVAELTKRIEAFEYQAMPRAEIKDPQRLAEPSSAPSYVLPLAHAASFPVDMGNNEPSTMSAPKQTLPHYLRFSEGIERAMLGPF
jgi:hypothetical protein